VKFTLNIYHKYVYVLRIKHYKKTITDMKKVHNFEVISACAMCAESVLNP